MTVELDAAPTELWAIYLPRVGQTAGLWVNGVHLGGGDVVDPLPRDWVNPLLFTVPAEILRPGANEIFVRLLTHVGAPGYLRDLEIGPERSLRRVFDRILWWQLGLTQVIAATTLTTGLLILFVAFGRPELRDSIWLAIGLVVWSWGSADVFFRRIFLPTRLWEWTVGIAPMWAVVCFALGFHRVLGIERPRHEAVLIAIASIVSAGSCSRRRSTGSLAPSPRARSPSCSDCIW
jgi:hypothetical protein